MLKIFNIALVFLAIGTSVAVMAAYSRDDSYALYNSFDLNLYVDHANSKANIGRIDDVVIGGYGTLVQIEQEGLCGYYIDDEEGDDFYVIPTREGIVKYRGYDIISSYFDETLMKGKLYPDNIHIVKVSKNGRLYRQYIFDDDVGITSFEIHPPETNFGATYHLVRGTGLLKNCRPKFFKRFIDGVKKINFAVNNI